MRLLVTGGRDYFDRDAVFRALDRAHAHRPITLLIHGAAPGADSLGEAWAKARGVLPKDFPAKWRQYPRGAAGPIRNQQMIDEGRPDGCVAFPGGPGTADMVRRCQKANIPVWRPFG